MMEMQKPPEEKPRMWSFEEAPEVGAWSFEVPENAPGAVEEPPSGCWHFTKLKLHLLKRHIRHSIEECIPPPDLCLEKIVYHDEDGAKKHKWRCKRFIPPVEQMNEHAETWSLCLKFTLYCFSTFLLLLVVMAVPAPWPEADEFTRCELARPNSLLREPMNTISNLGYLWVSAALYVCDGKV